MSRDVDRLHELIDELRRQIAALEEQSLSPEERGALAEIVEQRREQQRRAREFDGA